MGGDEIRGRVVDLGNIGIPIKAVLHRLGYPSDFESPDDSMKDVFEEEVKRAYDLIEPKGIYSLLRIASHGDREIRFKGTDFKIKSRKVSRLLSRSDFVVFFMATIGPELEGAVETLMSKGEYARSVILDAIGSETADAAADMIHRSILRNIAEQKGFSITPRFSPGYGDWPLTVQRDILNICRAEMIGVSLTDSFLMIPMKSVSAVFGWERRNLQG